MSKILVQVADKNYLNHSKSLFMNASIAGKWDGDFCLIANNIDDQDLKEIKKAGIHVVHKNIINPYYAKFYLFEEYFKNWDTVLYLDCDIMILDDINKIQIPKSAELIMEEEPFFIHQYFCQNWDASVADIELNKLRLNHNIDQTGFNSGVMYFNTDIINKNTLNELLSLKESLQHINNHTNPNGGDQPILNLHFLQNITPAANKEISYWRKASDDTVIMHFCRWDSPWTNNNHSNKLNNSYINQYNQNLNLFNTIFN